MTTVRPARSLSSQRSPVAALECLEAGLPIDRRQYHALGSLSGRHRGTSRSPHSAVVGSDTTLFLLYFAALGAGNGVTFQMVPLRWPTTTAIAGGILVKS